MTTKTAKSSEAVFASPMSRIRGLPASRPAGTSTGNRVRRVPVFIRADQSYYWSRLWQSGEAESRANLEAGNFKSFDDPLDAVRHLLDDC